MSEQTEAREQTERLHMRISPEELAAIDDWRFANRVASRSEAVRRLIQIGIVASYQTPEVYESLDRLHLLSNELYEKWDSILRDYDGRNTADDLTGYAALTTLLFGEAWSEIYSEMYETGTRLFALIEQSEVLQTPNNFADRIRKAKELKDSEHIRREEMKRVKALELQQIAPEESRK